MKDIISVDGLIEQIQQRDLKVQISQRELVKLWILQGVDMLRLHKDYNYTQESISEVTGLSQALVSIYITLANDKRLYSIITGNKEYQIERFNQKELKKLTTLNDIDFTETIQTGKFPKTPKEDKSVELEIELKIEHLEKQISELQKELEELLQQKELQSTEEVQSPIPEIKSPSEPIIEAEIVEEIPIEELEQVALTNKAISKAGGGAKLAALLGVKRGSVANWKNEQRKMSETIREQILQYLHS